ncbi:MAG: alpha/beta hydrolase [Clostridia bacterium]|nr:alpha/beta hydrolase [Clostridia bacterium]
MNKAELVFKAVDILCYPSQNTLRFKDIISVKDIPYGDSKRQKADLYYRSDILNDGNKHPLIVYFHGGGFIMGDKSYRVSISEFYADKGYFVYNVNYEMPPESACPEMFYGCVKGLNSVTKLFDKYNIDEDNIILTGDSSGAYICSYLAALKYDEDLREAVESDHIKIDLKGLMLMCGIYDLEVLLKGTTLFGVIPQTAKMVLDFDLKKDFSNITEFKYYDYISPANFVNDKWCSTFICWADDDIVCQNQGEPMAEKLEKAVPYFDSYHVKGFQNNHCFHLNFGTKNKHAVECMNKSVEFLEKITEKETVTV